MTKPKLDSLKVEDLLDDTAPYVGRPIRLGGMVARLGALAFGDTREDAPRPRVVVRETSPHPGLVVGQPILVVGRLALVDGTPTLADAYVERADMPQRFTWPAPAEG